MSLLPRGILAVAAALGLAGCGFQPMKLFAGETEIEVREVGRSLYCGTTSEDAQAAVLPDPGAVLEWQAARGVTLAGPETLVRAPYAIIEMGVRPTGGYGLAVSRQAVLSGERVILNATFVTPAPGTIRTQALSTPCVLVQLPPGRFAAVEVQDPTGAVRATGGVAGAPAPGDAAAPVAPETPPGVVE